METRKISISFGLLAMVALHAILMRAPLPTMPLQSDTTRSFSFDSIERNIANPNALRVNAAARDEVKRQLPVCSPCAPLQPPQQIQPQRIQPVDQAKTQARPPAKDYNLDLFISNDQQGLALLNAFQSGPLQRVAAGCNYQVYAPGDQLYKLRYSQWIPETEFPAILLTRKDGGHIYVASKADVPATADGIHSALYAAEQVSRKAEQLAKQANPVESSPDNCPDGNCKKPPFFDRKPKDDSSLFPIRDPDPTQLITGFLRSQGIGLESVAILVIALIVIVILFKR